MTDRELLDFNRQGLIPGPSESEEAFLQRVSVLKRQLEKGGWIPSSHWHWTRAALLELFDFAPEFLPAFYSNQDLRIWQGAATWVEGKQVVSIQLREALKKGFYLGLYKREEILAHEAVHAARSAFDESQNEEFFAYMTSEKKRHRILGPIIARPWEVWPFFLCMAMGIFFSFAYLAGAVWAFLGFFRLIRQHRRLARAAHQMMQSGLDRKAARAILFRLTDDEILMFSKGEKIENYQIEQNCLRWRLIRLAYLNK